jgi:hypothetical protein
VSVSGNTLLRGCFHCTYSERLLLPDLSKQILYLDQSFLSHAFRGGLTDFVEAAKLIADLAHAQLLVSPYSSIHETETHQWQDPQRQRLWEFIKQASRGHQFEADYNVRRTQISRGFDRFLSGAKTPFSLANEDALPSAINDWDDYYWIDVPHLPDNIALTRTLKAKSTEQLVDIFPEWRADETTFDEDRRIELQAAARGYLQAYAKMADRLARGDFMAALDSPLDSAVVETLLAQVRDTMASDQRLARVASYFASPYFAEVPCELLSAGLFAVLKDRVRHGHYADPDKARARLAGFFYDVSSVATYGPYCHAIFVDSVMFDFLKDRRVGLTTTFGTRVFARTNWGEFIAYLESVRSGATPELEKAIQMVHP